MSQENVEVVRKLNAAMLAMDWAAVGTLIHPDIEMDVTRSPTPGLAGIYRGLEETSKVWALWQEAWGTITWEPEFIDAGENAVIQWNLHQKGRGRSSGIEVEHPEIGFVHELREGKIARATVYTDKQEALEAAGLSE